MAATTISQNLDSLFKEVYADKLERLLPDAVVLQKDVMFSEADKVGDKFIQPVMLTEELGFTHTNDQNIAIGLKDAQPAEYKDAAVDGSTIVLRSQVSYQQAAKAAAGGAKSFETATARMLEALRVSVAKRLEILLFYGGSNQGLAQLSALSITATNRDFNVVVPAAQWADGIWAGSEGMKIEIYRGATRVNGGTINTVNLNTRTLGVRFGSTDNINANDEILFDKTYNATFKGLHSQLTRNTTDLFGIDQTKYALWRGNTSAVGGKLTVAKILDAAAVAVGRGLASDVNLYVNHKVYESLNGSINDANRRLDSSYSMVKQNMGSKTICVNYQGGVITVKPSIYVKQGEGYLIPPKVCKRIGAQDVSFRTPGFDKDQIFHKMQENLGFTVRCFTHQALFVEYPAHCVVLTGITV